jgi:hypothetical protein
MVSRFGPRGSPIADGTGEEVFDASKLATDQNTCIFEEIFRARPAEFRFVGIAEGVDMGGKRHGGGFQVRQRVSVRRCGLRSKFVLARWR